MAVNTDTIQRIPDKVGVYLLKDKANNVLYVGKAVSLKNRVGEHLFSSMKTPREELIREKTGDVEFLVTENEAEALILENNLIKQYNPPYNIRFKDDKSYPSLKVTLQNDYPSISVTRELLEDGSRYFGPYATAGGIRRVARYAQRLFGVRNCTEPVSPQRPRKPCLTYQIGMCSAPCSGKIDKEEYRKSVLHLCLFLENKNNELIQMLEEEMTRFAANLEFEKAALTRDRLKAVKNVTQKQRVARILEGNLDVVGVVIRGGNACVQLFYVRDGNLVGGDRVVTLVSEGDSPSKVLTTFIEHRYSEKRDVPSKILLSHKLDGPSFITALFNERRIHSSLSTPLNDLESGLIDLALRNAEEKLLMEAEKNGIPPTLTELREHLGLDDFPLRIEGLDVSNIGGEDAVGSIVTFFRGKADKKHYRRYKIRTVKGIDDYSMVKEVVRRRYRTFDDDQRNRPELLVIDGGIGHLKSALEELELLGVDIPVISIAKKKEEVFVPGKTDPLTLPANSKALRLIKKVRDEAHRFAINYHKKLRAKKVKTSVLTEISGIGEKRRKNLLIQFGSIEKLRKASMDEIAKTPLVSKSLARRIYDFLKSSS